MTKQTSVASFLLQGLSLSFKHSESDGLLVLVLVRERGRRIEKSKDSFQIILTKSQQQFFFKHRPHCNNNLKLSICFYHVATYNHSMLNVQSMQDIIIPMIYNFLSSPNICEAKASSWCLNTSLFFLLLFAVQKNFNFRTLHFFLLRSFDSTGLDLTVKISNIINMRRYSAYNTHQLIQLTKH